MSNTEAVEQVWIKSYPKGVRWDIKVVPAPVQKLLDDAVQKWPDRPAIDFMGRRISYRELGELSDRAAAGLQRLGVGPGVKVGLYLPNSPQSLIGFYGVLKAGGVVVNYSPLDVERVLEHKVEDSETDFVITVDLAMMLPQMERILHHSRLKRLIVGSLGDFSAHPAGVRAQLQKVGQISAEPVAAEHLSFMHLLDNDGKFQVHPIADAADEIAVLQYTGGTTGLPKGAMLTHGNLTAACEQGIETANAEPRTIKEGSERVLGVLPMFHIYSLTGNILFTAKLGAELVIHSRFDLDALMKDLIEKKITIFYGVPTMFTAILGYPGVDKMDLTALKICNSGGAPLPMEVQQRFEALTGCKLLEGWGMTETSPTGTFSPMGGARSGSCGLPSPAITLKFASLDDPNRYVPVGERGEMCIGGPNVMKGYWNNPAATAESMTSDGLFRTGDVAYMDADGFVFIVDRTKDMLLCGGFNVYPRVIEEAIYEHPDVAEVCVIGIDDPYRGQSPKAFIKLKPGVPSLSLAAMKEFLKDRLGKHEMIQDLEVRAELPKTAVGKLSKRMLVEEEQQRQEAQQKQRTAPGGQ